MKPLCNCFNSFSPSKTFVYPEALLHSFRTWVNGPLPLCFISFVLQIPLKLAMKDFRGQTPVTPASEYKQGHFLSQCACSSAFWEVIRSQVVSYRNTLTGMMVSLCDPKLISNKAKRRTQCSNRRPYHPRWAMNKSSKKETSKGIRLNMLCKPPAPNRHRTQGEDLPSATQDCSPGHHTWTAKQAWRCSEGRGHAMSFQITVV